jgi:sialidase-1
MTYSIRRREALGMALLGAPLWGAAQVASARRISSVGAQYDAWPTMIRRRNGELVVVYSGGREAHVCPFGRVELMKSRDGGSTWSHPQVLMDGPIDDRDAGIVETASGALLVTTFTSLAYEGGLAKAGDYPQSWPAERLERWRAVQRATTAEERQGLLGAWMLRSLDGGLTWSAPYRVPCTSPHGAIATRGGRLLYPGKVYPGKPGRIGVWESKNDGLGWEELALIPARAGDDVENYHELHGVETAEGDLVVHIRNHNAANQNETLQSVSRDGGKSWSVPVAIGVWGLPSHLLRLRDGRLLMTYSYRRAPRGNQARVSVDHGKTWGEAITVSADAAGDVGYPSTVEMADGGLLSLWYQAREGRSGLELASWRLK